MRVVVLGGTRFIGRAIVKDLDGHGHDTLVAHRGQHEPPPDGEVFNVAEQSTWSVRLLAQKIVRAAGAAVELVPVREALLPADLRITALTGQHLLMDARKIRSTLGWQDSDAEEALRRTVAWDLANPPDTDCLDAAKQQFGGELNSFDADDAALASTSFG